MDEHPASHPTGAIKKHTKKNKKRRRDKSKSPGPSTSDRTQPTASTSGTSIDDFGEIIFTGELKNMSRCLLGASDEQSEEGPRLVNVNLFYYINEAPCRLVLLTAAALNIKLSLNVIDLSRKEQFSDDYLKVNPLHTVPTMFDDDVVLWESRAICRYLIKKFENGDDSLLPAEPVANALVNQVIDFEIGTLYPRFISYFYPRVNPSKLRKLQKALEHVDWLLKSPDKPYAAGNKLTLADLCLVTTISTIEAAGIPLKDYKFLGYWYETVKKAAPGYKEWNEVGVDAYKAALDNRIEENYDSDDLV